MADDAPSSPKRKKVRAKYASSVSCRRSKLKCSGENPCQRCVDNGKRCFYSEDQTAAEALQNLSRPTPVQAPAVPVATNSNGNGNSSNNGASRRNLLPREAGIPRRASDASVLGLSMEARMARIESMMESLMQERAMTVTPRTSMERDAAASEKFHADFLMQIAGEASMPSFPAITQADFRLDSPDRIRHPISAVSPASSADAAAIIRVGNKTLAFPNPLEYQKYLETFFEDIAPYYPCINEMEFRIGSERLLSAPIIQAEDISLLALNYIIFACSDIATAMGQYASMYTTTQTRANIRKRTETAGLTSYNKSPGWQWFRAADDIVGKRKLSGQVDLCLAVYLTYADKANAAYGVIGIACRLCFQAGLHQQSSWRTYTPFDIHMRQRIFWTVYFLDRRISLSCGRPYGIRESDIDIEQPAYLYDKEIHPDQPLPDPDISRSSNMYLNCMVCWARLASEVWDSHFAASISQDSTTSENALMLDNRIKHWTDIILPTIPLLSPEYPPEPRQMRQHTIVHNSLSQLRLLLFRQAMLSLQYDAEIGRTCGDIALTIVQRAELHAGDTKLPTSFRFHIATSLGSAILNLSTLLTRNLVAVGLNEHRADYLQGYRDALSVLADLTPGLALARRIRKDFVKLEPILNLDDIDVFQIQHIIPANIKDIFPYTSLDFARQGGPGFSGNEAVATKKDPLSTILMTDLWSEVCKGGEGKYGVPWI
ncbi:hypothetical protein N0V90_004071 [Kalmusia sp. IMI 367209]|nr:hypothetical protein N0V90_004071 [Kalmusia sp. IMI 367209]